MIDLYEAFAEPTTQQYVPVAFSMVGGVRPGMSVLDVAAGTGSLSVSAAEAGAQVLATDVSAAMVARCAERLKPFPNCAARVMNGQALALDDSVFDVSFSLFGVLNFPNWRLGLRELARVTRSNGYGCVSVWRDPRTAGPVRFLSEALQEMFPDIALPPPFEGISVLGSTDLLQAEMAAAGFESVEVQEKDVLWARPSVDAFLAERDGLYGFMPMYAGLSQSDRDRLLPALRKAAEGSGDNGSVRAVFTAVIASGRRI